MENTKRAYTHASLGMLLGTALAGGLGVILFSLTGQAWFICIAGLGAGIGLAPGAALDKSKGK